LYEFNHLQTDEPEGEEEYDHFTDEEEFEVNMLLLFLLSECFTYF
jgi:hypothetical protein